MLTKRDEMRINRAVYESPQAKRKQQLNAKVAAMHRDEQLLLEDKENAFILWATADDHVRILEQIRDENAPKNYNDPWNNRFALAVRLLPEARDFAKDCWYRYIKL